VPAPSNFPNPKPYLGQLLSPPIFLIAVVSSSGPLRCETTSVQCRISIKFLPPSPFAMIYPPAAVRFVCNALHGIAPPLFMSGRAHLIEYGVFTAEAASCKLKCTNERLCVLTATHCTYDMNYRQRNTVNVWLARPWLQTLQLTIKHGLQDDFPNRLGSK
jgi:hypothetical protein